MVAAGEHTAPTEGEEEGHKGTAVAGDVKEEAAVGAAAAAADWQPD